MNSPASLDWQLFFEYDPTSILEKTGKFVQLRIGSRRIVAMGEIEQFPYHANLAAALLEREKIASGHWQTLPDLFAPPKKVIIVGGGWFKLISQSCQFSGSSRAYGKYDSRWFDNLVLPPALSTLRLTLLD